MAMRYWQSYRFVFQNPNWLTNVLLASVCLLIPWVGQIVMIGYLFEVIDVLLLRRPSQRTGNANDFAGDASSAQVMDALPANDDLIVATYPDFVFNRFAEYLTRGIWPFLVRLIFNMAVGVLAGFVFFVGMMIAGFAAAASHSPWLFIIIYGLFFLFYLLAMLVVGILTTPIYLRAGLNGDFSGAFSMEFYRDFLKRVGLECALAELFLAATGAIFSIGGLLLCYVGFFPVWALLTYAHHHLDFQLYELYLKRGGMPVPLKAQPAQPRYAEKATPSSHVMRPHPEERSSDVMRPEESW
jgi:hypothetical protein